LHRVADPNTPRHGDRAVEAEREPFGATLAPVSRERSERVEVRDTGVGVVRGHDAAADVAVQDDRGVSDPHPGTEPFVFLMRSDSVDIEAHAEAAALDLRGSAGRLSQPLERRARDERAGAAALTAIDGMPLAVHSGQRLAG